MKLLLVDDQNVVREALARALRDVTGVELVAEARTELEADQIMKSTRFDVAVTELVTDERARMRIIHTLGRWKTKVLVLTIHRDELNLVEAVRAGASGYLPKQASFVELVAAIRTLAAGGTSFSTDPTSAIFRALRRLPPGPSTPFVETLTEREVQVLRLTALGSSLKEVAATLCISIKTAEGHRAKICHKAATHNVADLTRLAVRAGLVEA